MTPDEYCQQKAAQSGSSFYYSFMFLPLERRRAITALYAFCREVDDVVDESKDDSMARIKLDWWRGEIDAMTAGTPTHPVTRALQPHLVAYDISRGHLLDIIAGMQMDLEQTRYLDYEGLKLYCHRVAGVVGLLAAGIFGASSPATRDYAARLGLALQLTNIIRDVGEDARRGRIYLPIDELKKFSVPVHEILKGQSSERFTELMKFQTQRARDTYRDAYALLPAVDYRPQRPGLIMSAIYYTLLDEIERDGYGVLHHRVALTPVRKLWIAWRTWRRGRPPSV